MQTRGSETPMAAGELALRPGWPSMFRGYLGEPEGYAKCFADGWYLTGDLAMRDGDAYFWFVGRADDVIKSAGHLIGPFEVESALMEHPAVAEAGVIGKPDPVAGEIVKAFISLKPGYVAGEPLARELLGHARKPSARPWHQRRSLSAPVCRAPAAARSCAVCCAPASSVCRKATSRPWRMRRQWSETTNHRSPLLDFVSAGTF
jgi:acyl-coenzyme A synthetase/AMP-(fatty) acid ligase